MERLARILTFTAGWILVLVAATPAQTSPSGVHPCGWPSPQTPPPYGEVRGKVEWYSDASLQSGPNDIYNFARSVSNMDNVPRQMHWEVARLRVALDPGFQAWTCVKGKKGRDLANGPLYYGNLPSDSVPTTVYVGVDEPAGVEPPTTKVPPLENVFMAGKYRTVNPRDMQVAVSLTSSVTDSMTRWEIKNLTGRGVRFALPVKGVIDEQWGGAAAGRVLAANETAVATTPRSAREAVTRQLVPLTLTDPETGRQIAVLDVELFAAPARIGATASR